MKELFEIIKGTLQDNVPYLYPQEDILFSYEDEDGDLPVINISVICKESTKHRCEYTYNDDDDCNYQSGNPELTVTTREVVVNLLYPDFDRNDPWELTVFSMVYTTGALSRGYIHFRDVLYYNEEEDGLTLSLDDVANERNAIMAEECCPEHAATIYVVRTWLKKLEDALYESKMDSVDVTRHVVYKVANLLHDTFIDLYKVG